MEADKTQDIPSANWKPRRDNGLVPIWGQTPENQESQWDEFQPESWKTQTQEELMPQSES